MSIPNFVIKAIQHACQQDVDGIAGPKTLAAAREYDVECDDFEVKNPDSTILFITVAQHVAGLRGRDLDGKLGPKTKSAVQAYLREQGIDAEAAGASVAAKKPAGTSSWAQWAPCKDPGIYVKDGIDLLDGTVITPPGGLDSIPTKKQRNEVFGDALALKQAGMSKLMTEIKGLPGRFNLGKGVLPAVHQKIVPHVKLAFELWQKFGVLDEIYKIWFFNYRHMRHDTAAPLSLHSWGIACDINAKENFAWYPKGKEQEIQPFTAEWYKVYPRGLSKTAVLCMKKAGFRWGGDWPKFRDPMHFELQA